mgnify:CR=1 FL=1|jgi:hypothetical protein
MIEGNVIPSPGLPGIGEGKGVRLEIVRILPRIFMTEESMQGQYPDGNYYVNG